MHELQSRRVAGVEREDSFIVEEQFEHNENIVEHDVNVDVNASKSTKQINNDDNDNNNNNNNDNDNDNDDDDDDDDEKTEEFSQKSQ